MSVSAFGMSRSEASTFAIPTRLARLAPAPWLRLAGPVGVALRPLPKISSASSAFRLRLRSVMALDWRLAWNTFKIADQLE